MNYFLSDISPLKVGSYTYGSTVDYKRKVGSLYRKKLLVSGFCIYYYMGIPKTNNFFSHNAKITR